MTTFRLFATACFLGFLVWAADPVPAKSAKVVVQLKDQSQVVGDMVGLRDGIYQVRTESLGVLQIPQNKIANIVFDRSGQMTERVAAAPGQATAGQATGTGGAGTVPDVAPLLKSITSNPELMGKIEGLKEDADIQAVVNDPEIMKAVASGNFKALMDNEKIKALMDNPQIQALSKDVLDSQPAAAQPQKRPVRPATAAAAAP